jgi:hypothetical protein
VWSLRMFADIDWNQALMQGLVGAIISACLGLVVYLGRGSEDDKKQSEADGPQQARKHAKGGTAKTTSHLPVLLTILAILVGIAIVVNLR